MVPSKDIYADKDGKLTDNPDEYAIQIAAAGVNLDDRVAKRYGLTDSLVSTDEPGRPVRDHSDRSSVHIAKAEDKTEPEAEAPAEAAAADAESASQETEATTKPAAKKGAKQR